MNSTASVQVGSWVSPLLWPLLSALAGGPAPAWCGEGEPTNKSSDHHSQWGQGLAAGSAAQHPHARPSAGHWGPGGMDESDGPACRSSQPSGKDSQGNRVNMKEDEQGGQGHQTAPKVPADSQGGCLEEGLRARP